METVVLTFERPNEVKGNIFASLNNLVEEDALARERAIKINKAISIKINSIIKEIATNIIKKIDIKGIEVTLYPHHTDFYIHMSTPEYKIGTTKLSPLHASATRDKYPIYSEEFSIAVANEYVSKVKGSLVTKEVSVIEEMILGDLKRAMNI